MAKLGLNGVKPEAERPDFENGAVGTQNDARLAMFDSIADGLETLRAEDMTDVTDEMYGNPPGTGEEPDPELEPAAEDVTDVPEPVTESATPTTYTLKVNGKEIPVTEDELIARAQKVTAADQYLADASRLYREATALSEPDVPEVDDQALARAIQMGTEEEAVKAIQSLRQTLSPPTGEIAAVVEQALAARAVKSDSERFKETYKDLLADETTRNAVYAFDTMYANDNEPASFERFEKAAKAVMELRGPVPDMQDKQARKAAAPRPVVGGSTRPAPPAEEREPTPREVIAEMAKARGQQVIVAGN